MFCTILIQILNYLSGSDLFLYLHNLCYFIPKLCQILPGLHTIHTVPYLLRKTSCSSFVKNNLVAAHLKTLICVLVTWFLGSDPDPAWPER